MVPIFDVEYELEKIYKKGLSTVFEKDDKFSYNKDDKTSNLIITVDYPDRAIPLKNPHVIIRDITYSLNTQLSFGNNFYRNVSNGSISNYGSESVNIIPYSLTLFCLSDYYTSKDLANRIIQYLSFIALEYFSETLNAHIQNVGKGTTSLSTEYPEKVFQTPVSVQGNMYWAGINKSSGIIGDIDTPLSNINVKF